MTNLDFLEEQTPTPTRLSRGSIVLIVGVIAFSIVLGIQLTRQNRIQPQVGEIAPNFTLTTFDGETLSLEDLRGQVVLINFWGSWCPPCRDEAPDLQDLYADYADRGFIIVGVNWLDAERKALDFVEEFRITYPNGADIGERIAKLYRIEGAPENFIIDQEGRVVLSAPGAVSYFTVAQELERLLGSGS